MKIGLGISPMFRRGGEDWSSYWTTRTPTALILTVLSDTSIKLDWTNGADEDYDGLRIYSSTDGVNFTALDTVAANVETYTATGLTAMTAYYFYVVAYKGTNESTATDTENNETLPTRILLDQFITNDPTPMATPRTCEPTGTITVTQNDGTVAISGGKVKFTAQSTPAGGDLGLSLGTVTRAAGVAMAFRYSRGSGTHLYYGAGFYNNNTPSTDAHREEVIYLKDSTKLQAYEGAVSTPYINAFSQYKNNDYLIILLSRGALFLVRGYDFANWTVFSVGHYLAVGTLYPKIFSYDMVGLLGNAQVFTLPSPLNVDTMLTSVSVASPTNGETQTGNADGTDTFVWTVATGETLNFMFRRTDDDNCWIARFVQADNKYYLFQKEGGSETERGATGGTAFTLTNGLVVYINIYHFSQVVYLSANAAAGVGYQSASFNATATGVKVTGFATGANLRCYPRTVSAANQNIINKYFVFPPLDKLLLYDGDSLTSGIGATAGNTYPEQCNALLPLGATDSWHNSGVAGQTLNQIDGDAYSDIHPRYNTNYSHNIVILWGGTNDLKASTAMATVQTRFSDYIAHCKTNGFTEFIVLTALPRGDSEPVGFEADRQTWNAWLRAQAAVQGFTVADVAADSRIGDDGDCDDTTYYDADKVHMTDAGYAIVAQIVANAINSLV